MKRLLPLFVGVLLIGLIVGCSAPPPAPTAPPPSTQVMLPTLTPEQVISRVQAYGVPYIKLEGAEGSPKPVGKWIAAYGDDDRWAVHGIVGVEIYVAPYAEGIMHSLEGYETIHYSTEWLHTPKEIRLIKLWKSS